MRSIMAITLSLVMCVPVAGKEAVISPELIKEQVSKIKPGSKVVIRLHSKEKVKGTLTAVNDRAMLVQTASDKDGADRSIAFDQVKEVGKPYPTWKKVAYISVFGCILVFAIVGAATQGQ